MCNANDKYGGLSIQEFYAEQPKDLEISYGDLDFIIKGLVNEKLIEGTNKSGWAEEVYFYKITKSGKKEIRKISSDLEFYKILSLMPPHYGLRYRVYNIEHFLFHAVFTLVFFKLTLFLISYQYIELGLICALLTFTFLPFAISYLTNILMFTLNQTLNNLFGKTYSHLSTDSKLISNIIVVIFIIIALIPIYFYSITYFFVSLGGIIISILFKKGLENVKYVRDKIDLFVKNAKELFNTNKE